jgi:hypothetical protein
MTGPARFDLGKLFPSAGKLRAPSALEPCIVGIAWNDEGVGLVALSIAAAMNKAVRAYINLSLGPIENDWHLIAPLVQNLPLIFHDKVPLVFLCDFSREAGQKYPIAADFKRAFGERAKVVAHEDVERWASEAMPSIAAPIIPAPHSWSIKPIRVAAETTLYAGNQIALSYAGLPQGLEGPRDVR